MTLTIRQLKELIGTDAFIFPTESPANYPTFEDSDANYFTDYNANKEHFDAYFVRKYGDRCIDFYGDTEEDILEEWEEMTGAIHQLYLNSWARLYYALFINYNPIYNVEEHTTTTYGQHVTDTDIGKREHTEGAKERTFGSGTDTSTGERYAYDSSTWVNDNKTTDVTGQRVNNEASFKNEEAAAKDTVTSKQHVDSIDRAGNIGTVSATDLLEREERLRRGYSFFKNCFLTIVTEIGAYYECDSLY